MSFEDITAEVGLIDPLKGMMGHAAAWGDVNGDGYPDLFVGTFADRPADTYNVRRNTSGPRGNAILINTGEGGFVERPGPYSLLGRCSGAAFADFDNDGDLDLILSNNSTAALESGEHTSPQNQGNRLYENLGDGFFTDVSSTSGLDLVLPFTGRNTFVLDYDGDGLLDILIQEDSVLPGLSGSHSRLYRNHGGFNLVDVTFNLGAGDRPIWVGRLRGRP